MSDDDALRRLRSSIAANERWSREQDRTAATAPGRDAFMRKFYDQVDPDRRLDPAERERRATSARKAHFSRLALASAKARRHRAAADELDHYVEAETPTEIAS
jgi:hypothetical protein